MAGALVFHETDCVDDRLSTFNRNGWGLHALSNGRGWIDASRDDFSRQVRVCDDPDVVAVVRNHKGSNFPILHQAARFLQGRVGMDASHFGRHKVGDLGTDQCVRWDDATLGHGRAARFEFCDATFQHAFALIETLSLKISRSCSTLWSFIRKADEAPRLTNLGIGVCLY